MERMALFIDSYDSIRFQSLLDRLDHDAAILQQEALHSCNHDDNLRRRLHFSTIQQVQIYRASPNSTVELDLSLRRTDEELKRLMNGLAYGIPWMVNLSLRNFSKSDLVVVRDSKLFPQQEQDATECVGTSEDEGFESSSTPVLQLEQSALPKVRCRSRPAVLSDLQGIFVTMAAKQSVDDVFLASLRRLPNLSSASFWIEPNMQFSYPSLLSDGPLPTPGSSPNSSLKAVNIQQDRIMSGGRRSRSISNNRASITISPTTFLSITTHVLPLCRTLETSNKTLRSLNLEHDICYEGMQLMTNMIQVNSTLKSLSISFCLLRDNDTLNNEAITSFTDALRRNKTLLHVQNHKASYLHVSRKVQQTLLDMLENDNYILRVIDLFQEEEDEVNEETDNRRTTNASFRSQKNLYLKLNFWGRQHFLAGWEHGSSSMGETVGSSTSRSVKDDLEAWIDLFHSIRDDLDCTFYFLSRNPSLITNAPHDGTPMPRKVDTTRDSTSTSAASLRNLVPSEATRTGTVKKSTSARRDNNDDPTFDDTSRTKRIRQEN